MVDVETEVYDKSGDNITGVRVIIESESGEISDYQILNKTQFDDLVSELNAKLDVIDDTYVKVDNSELEGLTLEEILENNNLVEINANRLDGYDVNTFTKIGHTHNKADITNLLNYSIYADNYNVELGETANVYVLVKDMRNMSVSNSPVVIQMNGEVFANGYTNLSGVIGVPFTPSHGGLYNFSVNNQNVQIRVHENVLKSMQFAQSGGNYRGVVHYNPEIRLCQVILNGSFSIQTSGDWEYPVLMNYFKPKNRTPMAVFNNGLAMSINGEGVIHYLNSTGSNGAKDVSASATYFYKEEESI